MVGTLFLMIFFSKFMDKLKLYMFATEQHVFIHFMKFPEFLVQVYSLPSPPPPSQTVKKIFFHGFIHFMKFLAYDDYCVLICWDLGSTRCVYCKLAVIFNFCSF